MQVQVDLSQLSETSLHALLNENEGNPLGTQILEELLRRDSTAVLKPNDSDLESKLRGILPAQQGL